MELYCYSQVITAQVILRQPLIRNMHKTFFLPFAGEFGLYILWYARAVHLFQAHHKIVCCRPGDECLFPSANDFYYDWDFYIADKEAIAVKPLPAPIRKQIIARAKSLYGKIEIIDLRELQDHPQQYLEWEAFKTSIESKRLLLATGIPATFRDNGIAVDVVLTARAREHHPFRNYQHWQNIVDHLRSNGLSVGIVGTPKHSQPLERVNIRSWEYGGLETCVEMISKSSLMITTDTGPAHLNVLIGGTTMMVIQHESWIGESEALTSNASISTTLLPREAWQDVSIVLRHIDDWLNQHRVKNISLP